MILAMRFFEFVSCCGSPTRRADDERSLVPVTAWASAPAPVGGGSRALRRVRRGKMGGPDWRPSLGSISEDNTATPPTVRGGRQNNTATISRRDVKRKRRGGAAGSAKVRHRSISDGYHR